MPDEYGFLEQIGVSKPNLTPDPGDFRVRRPEVRFPSVPEIEIPGIPGIGVGPERGGDIGVEPGRGGAPGLRMPRVPGTIGSSPISEEQSQQASDVIRRSDGKVDWIALLAPIIGAVGGALIGGKRQALLGAGQAAASYAKGKFEEEARLYREQRKERREETKRYLTAQGRTRDEYMAAIFNNASDPQSLGSIAKIAEQQNFPEVAEIARQAKEVAKKNKKETATKEAREKETKRTQEQNDNLIDQGMKALQAGKNELAEDLFKRGGNLNLAETARNFKAPPETLALKEEYALIDSLRLQFENKNSIYYDKTRAAIRAEAAYDFSLKNPKSGLADVGLIFAYMKILDPRSTVREGEFAQVSDAFGWMPRYFNWYNKAVAGQNLKPHQRKELIQLIRKSYISEVSGATEDVKLMTEIAKKRKLDVDQIVSPLQRARYELIMAINKGAVKEDDPLFAEMMKGHSVTRAAVQELLEKNRGKAPPALVEEGKANTVKDAQSAAGSVDKAETGADQREIEATQEDLNAENAAVDAILNQNPELRNAVGDSTSATAGDSTSVEGMGPPRLRAPRTEAFYGAAAQAAMDAVNATGNFIVATTPLKYTTLGAKSIQEMRAFMAERGYDRGKLEVLNDAQIREVYARHLEEEDSKQGE